MSDDFDNDINDNSNDVNPPRPIGFFKSKKVGNNYDRSIEYENFGGQINVFGSGKNEHKLFFWLPFILLFLISAVFFLFSHNSIFGWGLLVIIFAVVLIIRKILIRFGCLISIISWIIILLITFIVYSLTLPAQTNNVGNKSTSSGANTKDSSKIIQYSKSFNIPDNKGTYVISVNNKDNDYILKISVNVPKEVLPAGFKWDPVSVKEREPVMNSAATDYLFVCWKSPNQQPKYDRLGPLGPATNVVNNKYVLKDNNETYFIIHGKSITDLKKYMQQGDKLELLWFNVNEVGYVDVKETKNANGGTSKTGTLNAEKGYGLHPNITETTIPWNDIMAEIE